MLIKLIVLVPKQDKTILPSGSKEHPLILFPLIEVKTTISIDTAIYGMAVRGRTLYHCTGYNGLKMLNLSDKSVSDIIKSDMTEVYCVATSGDKLYYTKVFLHNVTCCDLHGTTPNYYRIISDRCIIDLFY
jgi:hypothetical protein